MLPVESASSTLQAQVREVEVPLAASAIYNAEYDGLPLRTPRALAIGADGRVVIADSGNHRIVVLNAAGELLHTFGSHCRFDQGLPLDCQDLDGDGPMQPGDGQFNEPWGVAVDGSGAIFVADTWNGRIQAFDADGSYLRSWGYYNTTNGELGDPYAMFRPRGVAVDLNGNVLVADTGNKRIVRFTPNGEFVDQVGGGGVILGRFEEPTDVAVDPAMVPSSWRTTGTAAFRSWIRAWRRLRSGRCPGGKAGRSSISRRSRWR